MYIKCFMLETLKKLGKRITNSRKNIIAWIEGRSGIFCAKDIIDELGVDKVAVYRTIDLLTRLDFIHSVIQIDGMQYFEKHEHGDDHHHHVICTKCRIQECIDCHLPEIKVPGFSSVHHTSVYTGLCKKCS